jgi:tubulin--tyrosine ligase-like protein 12
MYETCLKACYGVKPSWLPLTYNMETEFPALIKEYMKRKQDGRNNVWICKPWNLSRGLDITIVNDSAAFVKIAETGPKIACSYISNPVLFQGKKFDMRFIVLLTSSSPLKILVWNEFWIRFANEPFSLDRFDEYERHFTVMNYTGKAMRVLPCDDFKEQFEKEYPSQKWDKIQTGIYSAIVDLFSCVTKSPPPLGMGRSSNCRAMYGVDVILEWDNDGNANPVVLEVNFSPDTMRPCKSNKHFWNQVLAATVLGDIGSSITSLM